MLAKTKNFADLKFIIHKPSLGSREVPQKFGPDRYSRFDVFFGYKQKNRQTNKQTDKLNLNIALINPEKLALLSLHGESLEIRLTVH